MTSVISADQLRAQALVDRVLSDVQDLRRVLLWAIGDRLGFLGCLATHGPSTSAELAGWSEVHEGYAREWLTQMATTGSIDYDPPSRRFILPLEDAAVLARAHDLGLFFGPVRQVLAAAIGVMDGAVEAARSHEDGVLDNSLQQLLPPSMTGPSPET